jgi:prolyl-tRNA editing enzyme YbaK/EbsC (Cys-tRNA(Pro) deacylase)
MQASRLAAFRPWVTTCRGVIVLDQDLQQYAEIWAAAGTANAVFKLTWDDLLVLTGGTVADVAKNQAVLP